MNETINTENKQVKVNQTIEQRSILELEFNRNSEKGLSISMKSPVNWKLFASAGDPTVTIGKVKCYRAKLSRLDGIKSYFVNENTFEYDNFPNLAMLFAENIDKGVIFEFGAVPISDEKITSWLTQVKKDVKIFYLTHCKPVSVKLQITSSVIEKEEVD
jgi:hypothetical protein